MLLGAAILALLSIAALCLFGCSAILVIGEDAEATAQAVQSTAREAVTAEQKISVVADTANAMLLENRPKLAASMSNLQSTTANFKKASAGVDTAVAEINRPCGEIDDAPCGTIATANRALNSVRLAAGQVTAVSLKEREQLRAINQQESDVAAQAKDDLAKLGTAIDQVGSLAANDDLKKSLGNLNAATGAIAGMATDTQDYWHRLLHPKWPTRLANGVMKVVGPVVKFVVF